MDIQDKVMADFAAYMSGEKVAPLRSAKSAGRYADRVRVKTPQGSVYDGEIGTVDRVDEYGTVFVRLGDGRHSYTMPFARGELEVIG